MLLFQIFFFTEHGSHYNSSLFCHESLVSSHVPRFGQRTPKVGLVIVKTGGVAQQWRVSNVKIATGTLVTIKFENSEMIVDESWFVFDANSRSLLVSLAKWLSSVYTCYLDYSICLHVIDTATESCAPGGMQERVSD